MRLMQAAGRSSTRERARRVASLGLSAVVRTMRAWGVGKGMGVSMASVRERDTSRKDFLGLKKMIGFGSRGSSAQIPALDQCELSLFITILSFLFTYSPFVARELHSILCQSAPARQLHHNLAPWHQSPADQLSNPS